MRYNGRGQAILEATTGFLQVCFKPPAFHHADSLLFLPDYLVGATIEESLNNRD